jgi:uncharacterized membrane protein
MSQSRITSDEECSLFSWLRSNKPPTQRNCGVDTGINTPKPVEHQAFRIDKMNSAAADSLTVKSRDFYERAKYKQVLAIVLAAAGIMSLGFCASAGGLSNYSTILEDKFENDDETAEILSATSSGYGFAAFFFIIAVIFFCTAAIYIGPASCGSANEKMMMKSPQEPEAKSAV